MDEEQERFLRSHMLFSALNDQQWQQVKTTTRTLTLAEGENLFEVRSQANRFFVLWTGQIKLFRIAANGQEKILELIRAGESFATAVMFMEGGRYPVSADALEGSVLFSFECRPFLDLLRSSPESCFRIMADMSRRMRAQVMEIDRLSLQSARERLIGYLLGQVSQEEGQVTLHLEAPKRVLAARLSIQPETFSRILSLLKKRQLIHATGSEIHIPDIAELRRFGESA
ncbi:MAG: Crp/Fnr family transcriptional regulator [Magnetococcales bacterium]|nr:Crp/Fnr family transcriptional regulator [Magnetococcales bacterium]